MDQRLIMLFPTDYFNSGQVDADLKKEYDAVIQTGLYDVFLFSYDDWFNKGILKLNKHTDVITKAIYRGWMMTPDQYSLFQSELWLKNIDMVVSSWDYSELTPDEGKETCTTACWTRPLTNEMAWQFSKSIICI